MSIIINLSDSFIKCFESRDDIGRSFSMLLDVLGQNVIMTHMNLVVEAYCVGIIFGDIFISILG